MSQSPRGQATVEVVLALPVVVVGLLLVIQVGLVARSQTLVVNSAREGARAAAVEGTVGAAVDAARHAPGLQPGRVDVDASVPSEPGASAVVTVRYRVPTDVPLVGALLSDPVLTATVAMRVEEPT